MCAVVGVCGRKDAAVICAKCLRKMQHRGQESTGLVSSEADGTLRGPIKKLGLVKDAYPADELEKLTGAIAIGHNRYATAGRPDLEHAQPHLAERPAIALAANGDLPPGPHELCRDRLKNMDVKLGSRNDGETMVKYIAAKIGRGWTLVGAVDQLMNEVVGAYSGVLLHNGQMAAFRDPLGIRPLVLGREREGGEPFWVVASETMALGAVGARYVREIEPGEMAVWRLGSGPMSLRSLVGKSEPKHCVFELIYFSKPESLCFNVPVSEFRKLLGRLLAEKNGFANAEVVGAVPDSSNSAAIGFSEASGVRFDQPLVRDHYVGRTFIESTQKTRDDKANLKYDPNSFVAGGRSVLLMDDSIVRGTTTRKIVRMLREGGGAKEIHFRISSPPIKCPCHYGIATHTYGELIAANKSVEEVRQFIEADSLEYLSLEDLRSAVASFKKDPNHFCYACFDGKYPTVL